MKFGRGLGKMKITEVRVKLMSDRDEKLKAFCTVTFNNSFVVRDIKIIEGSSGPFVAMPSRKVTDHCSKCGGKNHLRAKYCNECGARLDSNRMKRFKRGRARLHTDIAHPINSDCREWIQSEIITAFQQERQLASQPGYVPIDIDTDDYYFNEELKDGSAPSPPKPARGRERSRDGNSEKDSFNTGIY